MVNQIWVIEAEADGKIVRTDWANSKKEADEKRSKMQEDIFYSYPNAIVKLPYVKFVDSK